MKNSTNLGSIEAFKKYILKEYRNHYHVLSNEVLCRELESYNESMLKFPDKIISKFWS